MSQFNWSRSTDMVRFAIALLLAGCGGLNTPEDDLSGRKDSQASWPSHEIEDEAEALEADTVAMDTMLNLFNENFLLVIKGTGQGERNFDRSYRITLSNPREVLLDTVLSKTAFADSLDPDFLQRAGLYLLDFDFVRSQSLYFNAFVGIAESDNVQPIDFFLTYAGPRDGSMRYWLVPDEPMEWE